MKNFLHHAYHIENIQLLYDTHQIQKFSKLIDSQIQTFSNADLNILQEFAILYVVSEKNSFSIFKQVKSMLPMLSEIRIINFYDDFIQVSSVFQSASFNIVQPSLKNENFLLRAKLLQDHFPYVFSLESQQLQPLYKNIPTPFKVAQLRGEYGIKAPYFYQYHI